VLEQTGVGIALENMPGCHRYFSLPEQLAELIDTLNHPLIGACWDTGHGHITSLDQAKSLLTLGPRLKATHIQDNDGVKDQHLLPYQGTIDWNAVARTLGRIGFAGDFTYEAHNSVRLVQPGISRARTSAAPAPSPSMNRGQSGRPIPLMWNSMIQSAANPMPS
jgi:sugar phosphate isomerase/epimerase